MGVNRSPGLLCQVMRELVHSSTFLLGSLIAYLRVAQEGYKLTDEKIEELATRGVGFLLATA